MNLGILRLIRNSQDPFVLNKESSSLFIKRMTGKTWTQDLQRWKQNCKRTLQSEDMNRFPNMHNLHFRLFLGFLYQNTRFRGSSACELTHVLKCKRLGRGSAFFRTEKTDWQTEPSFGIYGTIALISGYTSVVSGGNLLIIINQNCKPVL